MLKHSTAARAAAVIATASLSLTACGALGGEGGETVTVTSSGSETSQPSESSSTPESTSPSPSATSTTDVTSPTPSDPPTQTPPAGSTPNTDRTKMVDVNTLTQKVEDHAKGKIPADVSLSCMGGIVLVANETQKCSWMDSDGNVTRLTITVDWAANVGDRIEYYLSLENSAYTP